MVCTPSNVLSNLCNNGFRFDGMVCGSMERPAIPEEERTRQTEAGLEYHDLPIDSKNTDVHHIIGSLPLLFELLDKGGFYIARAMGRHRTDIAIALYYVMHPSVPFDEVPVMIGHRNVEKKVFSLDDIAARLCSVIKNITPDELATLCLSADYETEFLRRKKHLFDVNRNFE